MISFNPTLGFRSVGNRSPSSYSCHRTELESQAMALSDGAPMTESRGLAGWRGNICYALSVIQILHIHGCICFMQEAMFLSSVLQLFKDGAQGLDRPTLEKLLLR